MKVILLFVATFLMIFTLPNVFAEEIEQTFDITFDELDYKLETEEHKIVPIKFYVHNHDYKIKPEMYIRHHGKTISDYTWPNLNSGNFVTYILIDRNWSSGTYKIVLKYDETYLPALTFSVSRDSDPVVKPDPVVEKEKFETYLKLPEDVIVLPDYPPSWFVMNPFPLPLDGKIASDNTGAYLHLIITDPDNKESLYKIRVVDDGTFETGIMLDTTWKSGKYTLVGKLFGDVVITGDFTIENVRIKNKNVEILSEPSYTSTIVLSGQTTETFQVLTVSGNIDEITEMELVIEITKPDETVEEFSMKSISGEYSTDIVLYSENSAWSFGIYKLSITFNDEILNSAEFEIDKSGNLVFTKDVGSVIADVEGTIQNISEFDIGSYETNTFTISGKVDDYKTATKINVSIVKPDKTKQEISTLANSRGEYSIPIVLDETWPKGEYTVYTTYENFIDTPISFNIAGEVIDDIIIDDITSDEILSYEENIMEAKLAPQIISLPHGDGYVDLAIKGTTDLHKRFEKIPVILTMPDMTTKQILVRADKEGNFIVNTSVNSSWKEGDYSFSVKKSGELEEFSIFKVIDKNPNPSVAEIMLPESAMPGSDDIPVDSLEISNKKIEYYLRINHITFSGTVADKDLGRVLITTTKDDGSTVKSYPTLKRDNSFSSTINIDGSWSLGSYEVIATQGDHEVGRTEFLITSTMQKTVSMNDETSISEDMFLDSNGIEITINGKSFFGENIRIDLTAPDGTSQTFETRASSKPAMAGDQLVYAGFNKKIPVTTDWFAGTYKATATQNNIDLGTALIHITPFNPTWLQDQTKHWVEDEITDWQYKNRLRTLAGYGILSLPDESDASTDFPPWLRTVATLYADGETPQSSYLNSLQYLVDSGLLNASG